MKHKAYGFTIVDSTTLSNELKKVGAVPTGNYNEIGGMVCL